MSTFSIYLVYKEQAGTQASRPLFINFHCSSVAPGWWRRPDSNRRPSACKADALPTELRPLEGTPLGYDSNAAAYDARSRRSDASCQENGAPRGPMVGLSGLEPLTSRLSGERSNQLSYRPGLRRARYQLAWKNRVTLVLELRTSYARSRFAGKPAAPGA